MSTNLVQQLLDRIAALESRELTIKDLPMKALLDKLDQDWTPDARTLLLKQSVDLDKLDPAALGYVAQYTVATLPAAATMPWRVVAVTDGGAGAVIQASNGAAWVNLG
jgi:hypothetical protein